MHSIEPLLEGFRRFQAEYFAPDQHLFEQLRDGQHPTTLVIGCCDSRVHPATLTGSRPGEMFIVRNVANLVPPHAPDNPHASVAAALEFAVLNLNVERIIVMGHSGCGGIRALMQQSTTPGSALQRWLAIADPARRFVNIRHHDKDDRQRIRLAEEASILVSLDNLMTYPWLVERVQTGQLTLDGWYFDITEGALWGYDEAHHAFVPLVCPLDRPADSWDQPPPGWTTSSTPD